MDGLVNHAVTVFLALFAIMSPVTNTAAFVSLTADADHAERRRIALRSLTLALGIVAVFGLLGKAIFHLFGISMPALQLAGGILVFLVGYEMLHGRPSRMHSPKEPPSSGGDVAVSPLAVPLLAGPGTIATVMNYSAGHGWGAISITLGMFVLLAVITYVCFMAGERLVERVGQGGMTIVSRLMGLILAVIGVQMGFEGIFGAIALHAASGS